MQEFEESSLCNAIRLVLCKHTHTHRVREKERERERERKHGRWRVKSEKIELK